GGDTHPGQQPGALLLGQPAALHGAGGGGLQGGHALGGLDLADVDADDLAAGRGEDLGDTGAHRAEADDGDGPERGNGGVGQGSGHRGTPGMRVTTGNAARVRRGGATSSRAECGCGPGFSSAHARCRYGEGVHTPRPAADPAGPVPGPGRTAVRDVPNRLRLAAAASPNRHEEGREWVTRSSELNRPVTSAPAPRFVM